MFAASLGLKIGEVPIKTIYGDEKSSIPIITASIKKLIPTFIRFFYFEKHSQCKAKPLNQCNSFFPFLTLALN